MRSDRCILPVHGANVCGANTLARSSFADLANFPKKDPLYCRLGPASTADTDDLQFIMPVADATVFESSAEQRIGAMGAINDCPLINRIVIRGAAIWAIVVCATVAHGQQDVARNPKQSYYWQSGTPTAGEAAVSYFSPTVEASEKAAESDVCGGCFCNMCPRTYGAVEALILQRNIAGSAIPLAVDSTTGATLLSTNNLSFPFSGGLRTYV